MFNDSVIILTGASEGIGNALAHALSAQGARLVLTARNEQRLLELKTKLGRDDADIVVCPGDISDETHCRQMIEQTVNHFGRIDILVNNAGITMWSEFEQLTDLSVFDKLHQVNLMGAVYCTYYALPWLKKSQGTVVAVASLAGLTGVPCRTAYAASKHAMLGFFDSLRIEQAKNGIKVVNIAPDFVVSQIHKRALDKDGQALGQTPMQEAKIMSSEACADFIVKAIEKQQRLAITSFRGKLGRWLKLLAPSLIDKLAAKAIAQRH